MGRLWNRTPLACAWIGAGLWAIAVTVLEPLTEPAKPWHEAVGNNAYWVRDVRLMAIVAAVAAFVWASRGDRFLALVAVSGGVAWAGIDLALDRLDVGGPVAAIAVTAAASVAVLLAFRAAASRPATPDRAPLIIAAAMCAALVPLGGGISSPTNTEPSLTPTALLIGLLLGVIALGCALAAAPRPDQSAASTQRRTVVAVLSGVTVVTVVALRALDSVTGARVALALAVFLLFGLSVLTAARRTGARAWLRHAGVAAGALIGYPLLVFLMVIVGGIAVAPILTWMAGNPPVSIADTDFSLALCGLLAGLPFGLVLARGASPALLPAAPPRTS